MKASSWRLAAILAVLSVQGSPARGDVVTDWNTTIIAVTIGGSASPQWRALAATHGAIHDAVNAIEHRYTPYAVDLRAPAGASVEAAAAVAAHDVLAGLLPAQKPAIDAALAASLAKAGAGKATDDGVAVGKQVAERMLAMCAGDGFTAKIEVKPIAAAPGVWQLTPGWASPILTQWGQMKPMVIKQLSEFDLGPPPSPKSERFARDYAEIKAVGARDSTSRTGEQTAVAIFWTTQTMVPWSAAAQAASRAHKLSVVENARLFALLNMAVFDSTIVSTEQKYRYNSWRPYNAIRGATGAPAPGLATDASWEPLLLTPGHPEYPSGHCTSSGAAAQVLREFFGDDRVETSSIHPPLFGMTRSWKSFTQMEKEVENARVWGGIHFRTADENGTLIGRKIGHFVVIHALQPVPKAAKN